MLLLPLALGPTNMFSLLSSMSAFFRLKKFSMWSLVILRILFLFLLLLGLFFSGIRGRVLAGRLGLMLRLPWLFRLAFPLLLSCRRRIPRPLVWLGIVFRVLALRSSR